MGNLSINGLVMSDNRFGDIEVDSGTEGFVCLDLIDCSGQYGYIPKDQVVPFVDKVKEIAGVDDWISVSERLPDVGVRVLLFDKDGFGVVSGRLGHAGWYLEGDLDESSKITRWKPLPPAPTK